MIRISAEIVWAVTQQKDFWTSLADHMAVVLRQQAAGESTASPRQIIRTKKGDGLGVMAAITVQMSTPIMGVKLVSLALQAPQNGPSHPGVVILIDPHSGEPLASLDADAVTAVRTAATTCAVTRQLRPEGFRFTMIGTGIEARSHLLALSAAFPEARFTIWGRRSDGAEAIANEYVSQGIAVRAEPDLVEAMKGAEIITSVTSATSPFLNTRHLLRRAHINAVGASIPGLAEWAPESFRAMDILICDNIEECRRQSEEIPNDLLDNARTAASILGRLSTAQDLSDERTVYKSVGSAVLDVAASAFLLERMRSSSQL